jgi:CRP-like cAMP-binding protein
MRGIRQDTKVSSLRNSCLFEDMPKKHLTELARRSEDVDVPAGKELVKEGDNGSEFFVIVEGEADVSQNGRKVATRGPGEFFGEMALLESVPRTATVTAKTPLRFFVLTRQDFLRLLDEEPSVERKVLRAVARRALAGAA